MEQTIVVPQLSEKSETGILTAWLVSVGEKVAKGEVLYEVETEKAVHQVESLFDCTIIECYKELGDEVLCGEKLAKVIGVE